MGYHISLSPTKIWLVKKMWLRLKRPCSVEQALVEIMGRPYGCGILSAVVAYVKKTKKLLVS